MSSRPVPGASTTAAKLRHLLRTPLNHIIGYCEILLEDVADASSPQVLRQIIESAGHTLEIIQRLLTGSDRVINTSDMARLRTESAGQLDRMETLVRELRSVSSPSARTDIDRVASAVAQLRRSLEGLPSDVPGDTLPLSALHDFTGSSATGRILVVDDNEFNRDMLSRQLERQKHDVATAPDGAVALQMLRKQRFDVMLLDLMMPGMNGFEVLEVVKRDPALSGVAVIMISALDEMDGVIRCIEMGAEDYLLKPVNPTLLRARINSILDRLRAEQALRRKERLESIGLLASGIAHDFNNLLTGIIGNAHLLSETLTTEERDMAKSIVSAGERAAELTKQLLAYSGQGMLVIPDLDITRLVKEAECRIRVSLPARVHLKVNLQPVPPITGDPNQIQQALLYMITNAAEAIDAEETGWIAIETGTENVSAGGHFHVAPQHIRPGEYVYLEVQDTGCGMSPEMVAEIFEPFYTTKFLGRGLGLAAVGGTVRAHKGMLRVRTSPGGGTTFRLYFPVPVDRKSDRVILVVDDEPVVQRIVKLGLERAGQKVIVAESGKAAIDVLRQSGSDVDLVLLDWKMPDMDGGETLHRLREINPTVRVIVSSGVAPVEAEDLLTEMQVSGYLQKPYRISELVDMVQSALG